MSPNLHLQFNMHHRCRWHRWQMKKIFNQKNFNYFVWTSLGRRVNIYINFAFKFTFRFHHLILFPLLATGVNNTSRTGCKICRPCHWYWRQFCCRCRWHRWFFSWITFPQAPENNNIRVILTLSLQRGWACSTRTPPNRTRLAEFTIMMECTPESSPCQSICTLLSVTLPFQHQPPPL